jgi:hypothetical protein
MLGKKKPSHDFSNNQSFIKLKESNPQAHADVYNNMLVDREKILVCFKGLRDAVFFSNMRVLIYEVHGLTGSEKSVMTLPYAKMSGFYVRSGDLLFNNDIDLHFCVSGMGNVHLELHPETDLSALINFISAQVLK